MQSQSPRELWGADWPAEWDPNLGPDPPDDGSPFLADHKHYRWPTGCSHPAELVHGVLVFCGPFDHRDVTTAQRTYPHHDVVLTREFNIEIRPRR